MVIAAALLHTGARISPTSFTVHPSTVVGIVGLALLYQWGRGKRDGGKGKAASSVSPVPHPPSPIPFYTALAIMFFSLNGWLHDLGDSYLFSGHMVQHLMLAFVVAPLLIMGTPGEMLRPLLQYRAVRAVAVWITAPIRCFAIFNIVVAGWHLPPLYNYALAHHPAHIVQHLMFLAASVLMWWPVLSPMPELPRLSYPGQNALSVLAQHSDGDRVGVHLVRGHDSLSDVRERPADLGNFADERSDDRWTDHVDSWRAVFLHDHLDRLLPLAATKRRRKPVGGSGGLAGGVVVVIPRCPSG